MRRIHFQKDILPHLIAITIFLILTVIFFKPVFFESKSLLQSDITQWKGSAHELTEYRDQTGKEGLWTNSIFGGMPAYFISIKWGNDLLVSINWLFSLGIPRPAAFFMTAMLSMYIMLLCFKIRPYLAIIGAITFAYSSYNIIGVTAGHNMRILTVAFMPAVIGSIHLCYQRNKWFGFGLTGLTLALQLRPNHLQITYYLALIILIYILVQILETFQKKTWKPFLERSVLLFLATLLAVGTFYGKFYSAYELSKYSNRGASELTNTDQVNIDEEGISKTYAFQYSNGISDPLTLFIPNFLGGNQPFSESSELVKTLKNARADANTIRSYQYGIPTYWGTESPTTYYAGAIMVFLFVLGIIIIERKYVIWLLSVALLGILLSYGRNFESFNYFMFDYFPGYSKFRSVTFTMILPIIAIITLGIMALEKVIASNKLKEFKKPLMIAFGITGGVTLLFVLIAGVFRYHGRIDSQLQDVILEAVRNDRKALLRADSFRALIFISLFLGILYLSFKNKLSNLLKYTLLILLPCLDVLLVSSRFIDDNNYQHNKTHNTFTPTKADQFILSDKKPGDRVLNLTTQFYDAISAYHHHTVNGYNGIRLKRYQELIDNIMLQENSHLIDNLKTGNRDFSPFKVLNMLNTRYFIVNPSDENGVIKNPAALGSAWFISEVIEVGTPDEEFRQTQLLTNPENTAVINNNRFPETPIQGLSKDGTIELIDFHPGYWKYESNNVGNGLAVFSEIYYHKDFIVTIDGKKTEMMNANYILRALTIPSGQHTIEFRFEPQIYTMGSSIMKGSTIIVVLIFLFTMYTSLKTLKPRE